MSRADIAADARAGLLLKAWQSADRQSREEILGDLLVPGLIALRCRYWRLRDPQAPPGPWDPAWSMPTWNTVLRLETEGDEALRRNDTATATAAFTNCSS